MAQAGSKVIANASGQVVRLDIQNTLQTVATHNFGSRSNAGTILPCEFLADNTTGKLLIRKSDGGDQANPNHQPVNERATFFEVGDLDTANLGLLPKAGGTLTGVLQLPNGTQAVPALNLGDTSTGLYRLSTNVLAISANNTKKITVDSTATEFFGSESVGARIRLLEATNNGGHYVELKAGNSISNNLTLTLPTADGTSGQALLTNGSGTLSFGAPTVGAANLTGNTLASGVTASSLTSVGTLGSLSVTGTCTVGNLAVPSGAGIDFSASPHQQATSELLDDYEEGVWTPSLEFGSSATGITYTSRGGTYTKIGRQVTVNFEVTLSDKGSQAGIARIDGLPFSVANLMSGTTLQANGPCGFWDNVTDSSYIVFSALTDTNQLRIGHTLDKLDETQNMVNTDFTDTSHLRGSITYFTAT